MRSYSESRLLTGQFEANGGDAFFEAHAWDECAELRVAGRRRRGNDTAPNGSRHRDAIDYVRPIEEKETEEEGDGVGDAALLGRLDAPLPLTRRAPNLLRRLSAGKKGEQRNGRNSQKWTDGSVLTDTHVRMLDRANPIQPHIYSGGKTFLSHAMPERHIIISACSFVRPPYNHDA